MNEFKEINSSLKDMDKAIAGALEIKAGVNKTWADVVGEMKQNIQEVNKEVQSAKKVIENSTEAFKMNIDFEERVNNIVIYRMDELDDDNKDNIRINDKKQVLYILSVISDGQVKESSIKSFFRLGSKGDKARPIMVKFFERGDKNLIMENLNKLKNLNDKIRNVSISHDLNREQREERNKLVESAKKLQSEDKGEYLYRVKGLPGKMRVIKIKRTI